MSDSRLFNSDARQIAVRSRSHATYSPLREGCDDRRTNAWVHAVAKPVAFQGKGVLVDPRKESTLPEAPLVHARREATTVALEEEGSRSRLCDALSLSHAKRTRWLSLVCATCELISRSKGTALQLAYSSTLARRLGGSKSGHISPHENYADRFTLGVNTVMN